MAVISVSIKNGGKTYAYDLDTTSSVPEFRESLYNTIGVPPAQQKILIKGVLKDDADLSKLGIKAVRWLTSDYETR